MVSDTRSARKSRDELDGHGSKQKLNVKKTSSVQSSGNTGKASTSGQMTTSPLCVRKSKRLEKEMPPSTPPVKRTSERLGTCNTPSSLRRSDRGKIKKDLSFSSDSKQSSEEPLPTLKKKEKTLSQVTMESKKAEVDLEEVGMKRKKMNARKFRSLFKKQRIQEIVQDGGNELERSEKMVEMSSDMSDNPKNFLTSCSTENKDVSESSQDGSVSANFNERCMYPEEDAASPSIVWEHCNLEGTCLLCSKSKRLGYDSLEQELCSCSPMEEDLATRDLGAAVTSESAREFDCGNPLIEMHGDSHKDGCKKVCGLCNKDGDLLYCEGESCKRCYHLSCLYPPLTAALPGVWHCPRCVKKKLLFGVHSVSNGVESVWGVREVEVPNAKGIQQRQFLVKYHGLAHVHNHWVPEKQLLFESPCLVSNFLENNQIFRAEWMVPHRLLWKRPIQDKIFIASTSVISACEFEWLVKWRGLNYDHASWELDNSNFLCSSLGQELVKSYEIRRGKANKCCLHPYLLDPSEQLRLNANKHTLAEINDFGIKVCGKLQILDAMLPEIKTRGLQVLILFQLVDSGQLSIGNILEDLVKHRFGEDAFERVDAVYPPSEKQAAVSRFNMRKTGQFVFLLENRACSSIIRFSSLDVVVIYDSDWNPANDLRALKKISIDSKAEQIKVFRLYSSFTIEERALMLAKKNLNLCINSQSFSRSPLSWGATYLFSKLEEYHADSNSSLALNSSSGQSLFDEVNKEFRAILSENFKNTDSNSVISEATLDVGHYNTNTLMFGESKVQMKDGEVPHVFWKNLLEGKNPPWKHLSEPSPRHRKRVHYREGSLSNSEAGKDNMAKKCKKIVNESLGPASYLVELGVDDVTQATVSNEGPSVIEACNESENFHRDGQSSLSAEVSVSAALKERIVSSDRQQILHGVLQREMTTLCQTLKLPENVLKVAEMFLEYVIKNHHVSSFSTSIVQAFQISLCWVAASITKLKVDKMESLMLAKQLLDYQCTEEEASSVYSKMRSLKRLYLQCSDNITLSSLLAEEDFSSGPSNVNEGGLQHSSNKEESSELEIQDKSADKEHVEQQKVVMKDKMDAIEIYDDEIKKAQKKRDKRMKKLDREHQERIQELLQIWEDKGDKLERDHRLDLAFIRSIHGQSSAGMDKLKLLNDNFEKKIKDHDILKDAQLKNLELEHLAAINLERQKAADWLAKSSRELRVTNGHQSFGSQSDNDADVPRPRTCIDVGGGGGDKFPMSGKHLENENANKSFCTQGNNVISNNSSISALADAICCETPVENSVPIYSRAGVESFAVVELLNQSNNSSDNRETVPMNLPGSIKQVSDEIQSINLTEEHPVGPQTVPNEIVGHDQPGELNFQSKEESDKVGKISLSNDLVSQRGELEGAASGGLHSSGQPSSHSEQTLVSPNFCDLLPDQDSDLRGEENRDAPQIEMEISESTDFVLSNFESPIIDGIVTPAPSNNTPVDEDFGQLHHFSVDVSRCNQSSATKDHDKGRNSSQTAEPEGAEVDLHESFSHNEENLEMYPDCLDVEPAGGVANEQNVDLPVVLQNNMAIHQEVVNPPERPNCDVLQNDVVIPQEVASTSQHPNQAVLQHDVATPPEVASTSEQANQAFRQVLVFDAGSHPPGFLVNPSHQPTFWNSAPSLLPDPLQNELERLRKEEEQLEKCRADKIAEIKSDNEKKIEEIISQMRTRCEVKCQETEAEFRLKKNELDKNQKKVLLNKKLAEALRSKCLETIRASGPPGMQQGIPSFMPPPPVRSPSVGPSTSQPARSQPTTTPAAQTIPQLSRSHSVVPSTSQPSRSHPTTTPAFQTIPQLSRSPSVGPTTSQPARSLPITTPAIRTIPQISWGHSVRSSPVGIRSLTVQPVQHASALVSGRPAARPPVISAITPAQFRSAAPHLQLSSRPTVGSPVLPNTSSPLSQLRPGRASLQPVLPSQLPLPDLVTQKSVAEVQGGIPAPPNPPGFTQGLVADHQPYLPNNGNSPIPDIPSTFHSLEQSDLEMLGNALGNQTSAVEPDVVCLSD